MGWGCSVLNAEPNQILSGSSRLFTVPFSSGGHAPTEAAVGGPQSTASFAFSLEVPAGRCARSEVQDWKLYLVRFSKADRYWLAVIAFSGSVWVD
jgi:hypothetical protein